MKNRPNQIHYSVIIRHIRYIFFYLLFISLLACNDSPPSSRSEKHDLEVNFASTVASTITNGTIKDSILINHANESIAYYIPDSLKVTEKTPLVIFLDPQARGGLPLYKYKELAKKYGLVYMGSNFSKNGIQASIIKEHFNRITNWYKEKFDVKSPPVFVCGFSGGAKIAAYISNVINNINGIISCSGDLSKISPKRFATLPSIELTGNQDFNYWPSIFTESKLLQTVPPPQKYIPLTFEGEHEWPPVSIMNKGLVWLLFQNNHLLTESVIESTISDTSDVSFSNIWPTLSKKRQTEYCRQMRIKSSSSCDQVLNRGRIRHEQESMIAIYKTEQEHLQHLYNLLQNKKWTALKVAIKTIKNTTIPKAEKNSSSRILATLSISIYMQATSLITAQPSISLELIDIYRDIYPNFYESHYLCFLYEMKNGNQAKSIEYLKNAIELGFNEKSRISIIDFDEKYQGNVSKIIQKISY